MREVLFCAKINNIKSINFALKLNFVRLQQLSFSHYQSKPCLVLFGLLRGEKKITSSWQV